MSNVWWWILLTSAIVVLIAGISFYFYSLKKVRRIKRSFQKQTIVKDENQKGVNQILNRKDHGELLWEFVEKQKALKRFVLDLEIIEFCINAIIRNQYQKVLIYNDPHGITAINIKSKWDVCQISCGGQVDHKSLNQNAKKYKCEIGFEKADDKFDFILFQQNKNHILTFFENYFPKLKKNGLILIEPSKKGGRQEKKAINDLCKKLRYLKIRHEFLKYAQKSLVIAK